MTREEGRPFVVLPLTLAVLGLAAIHLTAGQAAG